MEGLVWLWSCCCSLQAAASVLVRPSPATQHATYLTGASRTSATFFLRSNNGFLVFSPGSVAGASVSQTGLGTTEQEHRRHEFTMWCAGQATTNDDWYKQTDYRKAVIYRQLANERQDHRGQKTKPHSLASFSPGTK
jgi:hypothetical protein